MFCLRKMKIMYVNWEWGGGVIRTQSIVAAKGIVISFACETNGIMEPFCEVHKSLRI